MKKHIILLVDDDELDVISVKRSFKNFGNEYILYTAYNGKEALSLLKDNHSKLNPDVILLDLNMPKMNGIEFLQMIRKDEALNKIKVFIMTTSTESTDRSVTDELGISGYIIKPLNYNDNMRRSDSMDAFVQFHLRKILSNEMD